VIIDTDVLIWFFRGNRNALRELQNTALFSISCVTQMELLQGAKNKQEQNAILKQLNAWGANVLQINEQVSILASRLIKSFSLSHGITIADALIAASALDSKDVLLTANTKHFDFIPKFQTKNFYV
jgi:predicted nucleic acid-binding protein